MSNKKSVANPKDRGYNENIVSNGNKREAAKAAKKRKEEKK